MGNEDNVHKKEFAYNTGHYKELSKQCSEMAFVDSNSIVEALTQHSCVIISGMGGLGMCTSSSDLYFPALLSTKKVTSNCSHSLR
jgi:hypothetical protein